MNTEIEALKDEIERLWENMEYLITRMKNLENKPVTGYINNQPMRVG